MRLASTVMGFPLHRPGEKTHVDTICKACFSRSSSLWKDGSLVDSAISADHPVHFHVIPGPEPAAAG